MKNENKIELVSFITPDYIYVPFDKKENLKLKRNKQALSCSFLGTGINNECIYSSVSGQITGLKEIETIDGNFNSVVIENDFKDKREKIKGLKKDVNISIAGSNELLKSYNIKSSITSTKTIVVNTSYKNKIDIRDSILSNEFYHEIIDTIDILLSIYKSKQALIVVDKKDVLTMYSLNKYINSFVNINIVHKVNHNDKTLSIINIDELLKIRNGLLLDKYTNEIFITVNYKKTDTKVIKVKSFTSLNELISILKYKSINKIYINGNYEVKNNNLFIITENVKYITII